MEVWRPEVVEGRRPEVLSGRNLFIALALHVAVFLGFWIVAVVGGLFKPKATVIPIDLTIVVNENLDGNEEDPPPLANPEPPPPPPQPKPKPKPVDKNPEPPKALEQIVTNVVRKVERKEEKRELAKEREKPKKTAKELRDERIARMRQNAVRNTKSVKIEVKGPSGNGRTAKQTMSEAEIRNLLGMGYRPGKANQLATSELQLGVSLVQMALNDKWESMGPKVGASGDVLLSCRFNSSGGLVNVRLAQTSGDGMSDAAALSVARAVTHIRNLPAGFLSRFSQETLTIRYHVRGM